VRTDQAFIGDGDSAPDKKAAPKGGFLEPILNQYLVWLRGHATTDTDIR
jgi:hypothetical protein